jgi:hypothetical protein
MGVCDVELAAGGGLDGILVWFLADAWDVLRSYSHNTGIAGILRFELRLGNLVLEARRTLQQLLIIFALNTSPI